MLSPTTSGALRGGYLGPWDGDTPRNLPRHTRPARNTVPYGLDPPDDARVSGGR